MPGKRAKRFLRFVFWVLLIAIVLAVSIPLWFPWVLRPAAKRFGATFQGYERFGYSQFAVTDVAYTNRNVRVRAARLELAPWRGHAKAQDWSVVVRESSRRSTNSPASVHRIYQNVSKIVSNVQHWIPHAALTNGYVQTPNVTIQLPGIFWSGERFSGQADIVMDGRASVPASLGAGSRGRSPSHPTIVSAQLSPMGPIRVQLSNPSLELQSSLLASNTSAGIFIYATNRWRTNAFVTTARFGTQGTLPETGSLIAKSVAFAPLAGDVSFAWATNHYVLDAQGIAELKQPLTFSAQVIGDMRSHRGSLLVPRVSVPHVWPFDVALDWSGKKFDLEDVHAKIIAGESAIAVSGAGDLKAKRFWIGGLALGTNEIDFAADLRWPAAANLCAQMTNLSAELVDGFLDLPYDQVVLDYLRLAAAWENGPVKGDVDFAGRTVLKDGTGLGAEGAAAAHAKGITVTNFTFTRNGEPVSAAHGWIPAYINPTNRPILQPVGDEPLQLQVTAHQKAFFWKLIEEQLGITLREPDVRAYLSGTWSKPRGRLSLRASEVKFRNAKPEWPPLENLSLVAHVHKEATEIEFLNFFAANQPLTFLGEMPLPEGFWRAPRTNAAKLDWRNASCRLQIDSAQIAAFVPLLPGLIAPQGTINADLGLARGGKLEGLLRIDGAGTRPIASLGALQDIEILCRFAGDKAQVNSYTALGGYSVLGGGEVQVDINQLLRRELPAFEFHLSGENVPLTRQADAVIRADLDATVRHAPTQPVTISGKLNLRDSLYLRELRDLVPGRLASADRRPPYFSVEAQPFADWRLNLSAAGHRFLKVRTPIFNGEVSADFRISGTLRDPVAVGDLTINSGLVRFPFGNIPVNQGLVSLTSDNPYRPQLLINGNDRVLGYDVNMELSGFADLPILQFSSTPPLSSEQILLMLTAGEIPRQGQFAFTAQERAQKVAVFLGRGILSDLGVGANSNRLTIRSGEHISESGRPTYSVEYELTDDWSVIGQYDQFNDFNLMLKWQVYSK